MLPRSVYGINWKNLHAQPSLDAKDYNMQALAITNLKSWMVQFIRYYFEVQARVLQPDKQGVVSLAHYNLQYCHERTPLHQYCIQLNIHPSFS